MESSVDLGHILKLLKKNVKLVIILPLLFLALAAILTFWVLTPKYEAETQILVNQNQTEGNINAQSVQNNLQLVNTYAEIVKSPRILDEVMKKSDNRYTYEELNNLVNVTNTADSQIINVTVTHESPREAESLANTIANVYRDKMPDIMNIDNVSILSKAEGKAEKVSPKPAVNLVLGLILGLIIAILFIFLKEVLDKRIKTEEEVEEYLNLPVLGSIEKF